MERVRVLVMVALAVVFTVPAWGTVSTVNIGDYGVPTSNLLVRLPMQSPFPQVNQGTLGSSANLVTRVDPLVPAGNSVGGASDIMLDNTGSAAHGGTGGRALTASAVTGLGGLESFTIAFWYQVPTSTLNGTNESWVIDNDQNTANGFSVRVPSSAQRFDLIVNGYRYTCPASSLWLAGGRWVFVAITWDGSKPDQPANWYQGRNLDDTSGPVRLITGSPVTYTTDLGKTNTPTGRFGVLNVEGGTRCWDARIDDVAIWGSTSGSGGVLTLEQLEEYRLFTLGKPSAVPEPATVILLAMGSCLSMLARKRK